MAYDGEIEFLPEMGVGHLEQVVEVDVQSDRVAETVEIFSLVISQVMTACEHSILRLTAYFIIKSKLFCSDIHTK